MTHTSASTDVARYLSAHLDAGATVTATWLNHYSAPIALDASYHDLQRFSFVGIDGMLLKKIVRADVRTSADLVLPELFGRLRGARVFLIGGHAGREQALRRRVDEMLACGSRVVGAMDGYQGLLRSAVLGRHLEEADADVVIVGLGAGLQEAVAAESAQAGCVRIAVTCGGYLDQILHHQYYPRWAYPLRLNWLVRLLREPRRLWRRYTVDAARAVVRRKALKKDIAALGGYRKANSCGLE